VFVIESNSANAARKTGILIFVMLLLLQSFGGALTMHVYVRPSRRPVPQGTRLFGFQIKRGSFPLRRLMLFIFSLTMLIAGLYWTIEELFWTSRMYAMMILAGVFPAFIGGYLLWSDSALRAVRNSSGPWCLVQLIVKTHRRGPKGQGWTDDNIEREPRPL
jgi:hypothetical protein